MKVQVYISHSKLLNTRAQHENLQSDRKYLLSEKTAFILLPCHICTLLYSACMKQHCFNCHLTDLPTSPKGVLKDPINRLDILEMFRYLRLCTSQNNNLHLKHVPHLIFKPVYIQEK